MPKEYINPEGLVKSSTFSRAVKTGNIVWAAGTVGRDASGRVAGDGRDFKVEARAAFANIEKVMTAAGAKMSDIVRLTILMTDASSSALIGDVIKEVFPGPKPAITGYGVKSLGNPGDNWHVEIEATAVIG